MPTVKVDPDVNFIFKKSVVMINFRLPDLRSRNQQVIKVELLSATKMA